MLIIISQIVPDAESHQFWCSFPSLPWHIHRYHAFMQKLFFFSSHNMSDCLSATLDINLVACSYCLGYVVSQCHRPSTSSVPLQLCRPNLWLHVESISTMLHPHPHPTPSLVLSSLPMSRHCAHMVDLATYSLIYVPPDNQVDSSVTQIPIMIYSDWGKYDSLPKENFQGSRNNFAKKKGYQQDYVTHTLKTNPDHKKLI